MKKVFSGIQPTGHLHLGNYLGAIKNWVEMQNGYDCIYCIVDLHAITQPQNPQELQVAIYETLAAYIASGLDPVKNIIFLQSTVPAHSELAWILSSLAPLGWLNRMTQFKDKAGKDKESAPLGLFSYPVLMAADILLYKADCVPVAYDQKQHLELTRDLAGLFNRHTKSKFFTLPEFTPPKVATRIMSLCDGTKKMSKSDISDYSRINLTDDADLIALKLQKAKSDSFHRLTYDKVERPEASNLIDIYAALANIPIEKVVELFVESNFSQFKKSLAELIIDKIAPITMEISRLMKDRGYLQDILKDGEEKANAIANRNMTEIKKLMGLGWYKL